MGVKKEIVLATDFSEGSRKSLLAAAQLFPASRINLVDAYEIFMDAWCPPHLADRYREVSQGEIQKFIRQAEIPESVRQRIRVVSADGTHRGEL